MSNCGEYMFIILPAYFNTLCNITTWGELVSESGASCLRVSLMWGESSCVQTFRPKSVSPEVFDNLPVLFRSYFSFSQSTNKLLLNHFVLRKTIPQYFTHAFNFFYSA